MNPADPVRFAKLLVDYRNEELDEGQRKEVEKILAGSPRLQQLMHDLDDKGRTSRELELMASFDTKKALAKIIRPKRRIAAPRWLKYAAAVVLPLAAVSVWLVTRNVEDVQVAQTAPAPAYQAVLTLASGEAVALDTVSHMAAAGLNVVNDHGELNVTGMDETGAGEAAAERMYTLDIPNKLTYKIVLDDGTAVWLNAGSTLRFPSRFSGGQRRVELAGEGYFEVAKDPAKPFIVVTDRMDVRVTGTSFNVRAYRREASVQATLVEGAVSVSDRHGTETRIRPGEQAMLDKDNNMSVRNVDVEPFVAWRYGLFYFKDSRLEDIMHSIGRWYDMEVVYLDQAARSTVYSGKMKMYETIEDVLRKFEKSGGVKATILSGKIYVASSSPAQ